MIERALGATGMTVSPIGLGTAELGLDYGIAIDGRHRRPTEAEAIRFVHAALDRGVTLFDTAPAYGDSEARLGRALAGRRSGVVIATKVSLPPSGQAPADAAIADSVARSLRVLRTDVLDVVQLHSVAASGPAVEDALEALRRQREAGTVRAIGMTTYGIDAAVAALDARVDVLQVALNPLDRALVTGGILGRAAASGVGIIARSVLLRGVLTAQRGALPAELGELERAVTALASIADAHGMDLPTLAYRHVLAIPGVASALIGTIREDELDVAIRADAMGPLPMAAVDAIERVLVADAQQLDPRTWPADDAWGGGTAGAAVTDPAVS